MRVASKVVLKVLLRAEKTAVVMAESLVASMVEKKVVRSAGERAVSEMNVDDYNNDYCSSGNDKDV